MQIASHFVHKYAEMHPISDHSFPAFCTIYVRKSGGDEPESAVSPSVRWLFICRRMAIGVIHEWPSDSTPMAIGLQMNGHRTADGWCFGHKSPPFLPFEGQISLVDYACFERLYFVYILYDSDLARFGALKIAYIHTIFPLNGNTRFSRLKYAI